MSDRRSRVMLPGALNEIREILTQSEMQCNHPQESGDLCDGLDCIYCAVILLIDDALKVADSPAEIARLEYAYWRDLAEPQKHVEFLTGVQYGGMGAAANICAALALEKTVTDFKADIDKRAKPTAPITVSTTAEPKDTKHES